ncbi:MAG: DUF4258 domain-containing protein [Gammaproteobacteria bacterium]
MLVPRVTATEARDLLQHCLEQGEVIRGYHCRQKQAAEKITNEEIVAVLRQGQIYMPPEPDIKTGEWKYRIEGDAPTGRRLAVVFSFKSVEQAFLITVFCIESRGSNHDREKR